MIVSELMAILSELPGDMEVLVNHERTKIASPELFVKTASDTPSLMIVPANTTAFEDATERYYWRRIHPTGE